MPEEKDEILEKCEKVESILEQSDIVWSRYGGDSIANLAVKIVKSLEKKEDEGWW